MDEAGIVTTDKNAENTDSPLDELNLKNSGLNNITPLEKLKEDLTKAVKEERYEDAAKLRDEIMHLKNTEKGN